MTGINLCANVPTPARNPLIRLLQRQRMKQGRSASSVSVGAGYSRYLLPRCERNPGVSLTLQSYIDIVQALGGKVIVEFPDERVEL